MSYMYFLAKTLVSNPKMWNSKLLISESMKKNRKLRKRIEDVSKKEVILKIPLAK